MQKQAKAARVSAVRSLPWPQKTLHGGALISGLAAFDPRRYRPLFLVVARLP